jgi:hypothetical protein
MSDRYNAEEIVRGDTEYRPESGDAALPPAGGAIAADYDDGVQPGFDPRAEDREAARSEDLGSVSKRKSCGGLWSIWRCFLMELNVIFFI